MMKKGFSFVLMILVLLIGFRHAIIVTHFKLNRQFITQNYCINRDTPAIKCNGLCHLKRQLNKTQESGSIPMNCPKADLMNVPLVEWDASHAVSIMALPDSGYQENFYDEPSAEIFIPPPIDRSTANEYST